MLERTLYLNINGKIGLILYYGLNRGRQIIVDEYIGAVTGFRLSQNSLHKNNIRIFKNASNSTVLWDNNKDVF